MRPDTIPGRLSFDYGLPGRSKECWRRPAHLVGTKTAKDHQKDERREGGKEDCKAGVREGHGASGTTEASELGEGGARQRRERAGDGGKGGSQRDVYNAHACSRKAAMKGAESGGGEWRGWRNKAAARRSDLEREDHLREREPGKDE
jgi:hypothetical protein